MSELSEKARKWLEHIRLSSEGGGMYPGTRQEDVPRKVSKRLYGAGLISPFTPHNPAHKERWIITLSGRGALASEIGATDD